MRAATQKRIKILIEQGIRKPGEGDELLGHCVGQVGR
jgi:hypothetical protein